jgi:hypothetical protein
MPTPAKGKRFVKVVRNPETGRTRKVSYGQAGTSRPKSKSTVSASAWKAMKRGFK